MSFEILVTAKTDIEQFRTISVAADGSSVDCDCDGFDGQICSHIDAVLVAGERAMVRQEDWAVADAAMRVVEGRVQIPATWKGSWRRNLRWRGLSTRSIVRRRVGSSGKPVVCFTGAMERKRSELIGEAEANGWETVDAPSRGITVLVAADPLGSSNKLNDARRWGTPIVTVDEWAAVMVDGSLPEVD